MRSAYRAPTPRALLSAGSLKPLAFGFQWAVFRAAHAGRACRERRATSRSKVLIFLMVSSIFLNNKL